VFGSVVLGEIFGSKRQEVARDWRKLRNEELYHLYSIPNIIQVIKPKTMIWAGHVARMGEGNTNRVLVGKNEGKIPLGILCNRWEGSKD
jgi:hypothetical protein